MRVKIDLRMQGEFGGRIINLNIDGQVEIPDSDIINKRVIFRKDGLTPDDFSTVEVVSK